AKKTSLKFMIPFFLLDLLYELSVNAIKRTNDRRIFYISS
ncbi:MAG: hypothetical protein ACI9WT_001313, partial [Flavobacterium sp.]